MPGAGRHNGDPRGRPEKRRTVPEAAEPTPGVAITRHDRARPTAPIRTAGALALLLLLPLAGCDRVTDETPDRVRTGVDELDLTVTGRPTPGSLTTTERVLARLRAHDAAGLAGLAGKTGGPKTAAERWVARWSAAARHPATADFAQGEKEATVDIHFPGEPAPLSLLLLPEDENDPYADRYVVVLEENA
ncbi:hypothetical protein [Streptomyces cinereoruber]|uniref:hypothetical protein n=1 Tax=Streptomyces cinereoruber TaxID=67260 RepID=UPI0036459B55